MHSQTALNCVREPLYLLTYTMLLEILAVILDIAKLSLYKTQYRLINLLVTDFYRKVSYNISTSVYLRNLAAIEHAHVSKNRSAP